MVEALKASDISDVIKSQIKGFDVAAEVRTEGTIVNLKDGIVSIYGLTDVMFGEMIAFPGDTFGLAFNLERDSVSAIVLGSYGHLEEGMKAHCTGRILEVLTRLCWVELLMRWVVQSMVRELSTLMKQALLRKLLLV